MRQAAWKNNWRETYIVLLLCLLLVGLLVSRALVSITSVLLLVPMLYTREKLRWLPLAAIALLLLPIVWSGVWSDEKALWWNSVSVKLPLLTLALGLSVVQLSAISQKQITWVLVVVVVTGACWSLSHYTYEIQQAYLRAKTLPTPMDNDHIRFSWLVAVTVLLGAAQCVEETNKAVRAVLALLLVLLVAYLHVLAAKTGLLCLYGGVLVFVLYNSIAKRKWKTALALLLVFSLVAYACYQLMPTLRNRVQYVVYDASLFMRGEYRPGYNDAARWTSIRAGYDIMNSYPFTGVGAGDVYSAVNQWHNRHRPQSLPYERFLPASEGMVYGAAAGWPGFLLFAAGMALLLYTSTARNAWSCALSFITLLPFLIDDTLEGQYGVVILAFIVFFGQPSVTRTRT